MAPGVVTNIPRFSTTDKFQATAAEAPWSSILAHTTRSESAGPRLQWVSQKDNVIEISSARWKFAFSNVNNPWYANDAATSATVDAEGAAVLSLPETTQMNADTTLETVCKNFDFLADVKGSKAPVMGLFALLLDTKLSLSHDKSRFNGLWLIPTLVPVSALRLKFTIDRPAKIQAEIAKYIKDEFGAAIPFKPDVQIPISICISQTTSYAAATAGAVAVAPKDQSYVIELTFPVEAAGMDLTLAYSSVEGASFTASRSETTGSSKGIMQDLEDALPGLRGVHEITLPSEKPDKHRQTQWFGDARFWFVRLRKATTDMSVAWQLGLLCTYAKDNDQNSAPWISLTYESSTATFDGKLLVGQKEVDKSASRSFSFDPVTEITRKLKLAKVSLFTLCKLESKPPPWLPTDVKAGDVSVAFEEDGTQLSFGVLLASPSKPPQAGCGMSGFVWSSFQLQSILTHNGTSSVLQVLGRASLLLTDSDSPSSKAVALSSSLQYSPQGKWSLKLMVENLQMDHFARFFDDDGIGSTVKSLLGQIKVRSAEVDYTFTKGQSSSFCFTGVVQLGELELNLVYQYASSALEPGQQTAAEIKLGLKDAVRPKGAATSAWHFVATLGASGKSTTLGVCLESLHKGLADNLPDFVKNINVTSADGQTPAVELALTKAKDDMLVLILWISIADCNVTFVQASSKSSSTRLKKQFLRVSAAPFKIAKGVPLLNRLPQPFDQLVYVYVGDAFGVGGMSSTDMAMINLVLGELRIPLLIPDTAPGGNSALPVGHNLEILDAGKLLLGHSFAPKTSGGPVAAGNHKTGETPPTKAPFSKTSVPFIKITALSVQYKGGSMHLQIDGTFTLGPLSLTLIGFEIVIDLENISLDKLMEAGKNIHADLHGAGLSFDRPPLLLAGAFLHETAMLPGEQREIYAGGIAVGIKAWKFVAVGEYSKTTRTNGSSYTSVFIFAKLDGPLVSLEFATISGVRLGFGYNSRVKPPTLDNLGECPFVGENIKGKSLDDPATLLSSMMVGVDGKEAWVSEKEKEMWFLMGMTITAFNILTVTAVAIIDCSDEEVKISLLADAIGQMPPAIDSDVSKDMTLFYIELLILATINIRAGSFLACATLGSDSHVFVPQCKLHGQAFLGIWFAPSEHEGDFVLSVGGFHRDYKAPAHYASKLDRIGMSCVVGDSIHISGGAYFALTPKAVMAGGELLIVLDVGPVHASAHFVLDVFINFAPFHYAADLSISVHCHANLDIGITNLDAEAEISCRLHIEGPTPFHGRAFVDFHVFQFHIDFGDDEKDVEPALSLDRFIKLIQAGNPAQASGAHSKDAEHSPLKITAIDGLSTIAMPDAKQKPTTSAPAPAPAPVNNGLSPRGTLSPIVPGPAAQPEPDLDKLWPVHRGSFAFRVNTDFALTQVIVQGVSLSTDALFYCKPMHFAPAVESLTSTLTINIYKHIVDPKSGKEIAKSAVPGFRPTLIYTQFPTNLWDKYDSDQDPSLPNASLSNLRDGTKNATMRLCSGVEISHPASKPTQSNIDDFTPISRDIPTVKAKTESADRPLRQRDGDLGATMVEENKVRRYKRLGQDWLDGLNRMGTGNIFNEIDQAMGWDRGREGSKLTFDPPKRYLDGFADLRLALPIVTVGGAA